MHAGEGASKEGTRYANYFYHYEFVDFLAMLWRVTCRIGYQHA
jgi:hypothetical protein